MYISWVNPRLGSLTLIITITPTPHLGRQTDRLYTLYTLTVLKYRLLKLNLPSVFVYFRCLGLGLVILFLVLRIWSCLQLYITEIRPLSMTDTVVSS